jgi:hypothetical protein
MLRMDKSLLTDHWGSSECPKAAYWPAPSGPPASTVPAPGTAQAVADDGIVRACGSSRAHDYEDGEDDCVAGSQSLLPVTIGADHVAAPQAGNGTGRRSGKRRRLEDSDDDGEEPAVGGFWSGSGGSRESPLSATDPDSDFRQEVEGEGEGEEDHQPRPSAYKQPEAVRPMVSHGISLGGGSGPGSKPGPLIGRRSASAPIAGASRPGLLDLAGPFDPAMVTAIHESLQAYMGGVRAVALSLFSQAQAAHSCLMFRLP